MCTLSYKNTDGRVPWMRNLSVAVTFSKWLFLRNDTSYLLVWPLCCEGLSVPISFLFLQLVEDLFPCFHGRDIVLILSCLPPSRSHSCLPIQAQRSLLLTPAHPVTVYSRSYQESHCECPLLLFVVACVVLAGLVSLMEIAYFIH